MAFRPQRSRRARLPARKRSQNCHGAIEPYLTVTVLKTTGFGEGYDKREGSGGSIELKAYRIIVALEHGDQLSMTT
jgi:hypothetical protein